MNEPEQTSTPTEKSWCDRIVAIIEATEPEVDESWGILNITDETKPFIANAWRELLKAIHPNAKLQKDMTFTPHRVGALLGHKWAFFGKLGSELNPSESFPTVTHPALKECADTLREGLREMEASAPTEKKKLKKAILESFNIALDQTENDTHQFLNGFTKALKTGAVTKSCRPVAANATTQLCIIVLMLGADLDKKFRTVTEFHGFLTRAFGQNIAGSLERMQKFCYRIQLSFEDATSLSKPVKDNEKKAVS